MAIDLNCDLGEGAGEDLDIVPLISSVNVACGFHAGDPVTIRATVRLAARHGVAVGAHPSYPDRAGFGRAPMARSPAEVRDDVIYQVAAVRAFCAAEGVPLVHVKPHGALYNTAAQDPALAAAICEAVRQTPALVLTDWVEMAMGAPWGWLRRYRAVPLVLATAVVDQPRKMLPEGGVWLSFSRVKSPVLLVFTMVEPRVRGLTPLYGS
jgi:hypothetical protein